MKYYQKFRNALLAVLSWMTILIMVALTLLVIWQVLSRYGIGEPSKCSEEIATALMIWAGLFGAVIGFERKSHLGVDLLTHFVDPSSQKVMAFFGWFIVFIFAVAVMGIGGYEGIAESFIRSNRLNTLPWINRGVVYLPIPFCGLMIAWLAVEQGASLLFGINFSGKILKNDSLIHMEVK